MIIIIDPEDDDQVSKKIDDKDIPEPPPGWMLFLMFLLVFLRSIQAQGRPETAPLNRTIWVVMIILIVLILAGTSNIEYADRIINHLPFP